MDKKEKERLLLVTRGDYSLILESTNEGTFLANYYERGEKKLSCSMSSDYSISCSECTPESQAIIQKISELTDFLKWTDELFKRIDTKG